MPVISLHAIVVGLEKGVDERTLDFFSPPGFSYSLKCLYKDSACCQAEILSHGCYFLTLCCTYRGEWGSKNLLSAITTKPLMVITHNKTRKSVLPIFYNLSVNMQMRHSLIPDVLLIMLHLSS